MIQDLRPAAPWAAAAGAPPIDLAECCRASTPEHAAARLLARLTDHLDVLDRLARRDYEHDSRLWEPLLAELGRFGDRRVFRLLRREPRFESLRAAYAARFQVYARARDLARSGAVRAAQACGRPSDALSASMHRFLEDESATLWKVMADRGEARDLVVVGCGASPETLIHYARAGAGRFRRLVAVEIEPGAAALAASTLCALGLDRAEVRVADGADLDYREAAAVHVANYVVGKTAVLAAAARSAAGRAVVVVRQPLLLETLICEAVAATVLAPYRVLARLPARYCRMASLYVRVGT